jgi:mitogen-activated protein kinase kinase
MRTMIGTSLYMSPERMKGQSYTITSDVWSLGVTLLEAAQQRFPYFDPANPVAFAGLIDVTTLIITGPVPKLEDMEEKGVKWSEDFKHFIECWWVPMSLGVKYKQTFC